MLHKNAVFSQKALHPSSSTLNPILRCTRKISCQFFSSCFYILIVYIYQNDLVQQCFSPLYLPLDFLSISPSVQDDFEIKAMSVIRRNTVVPGIKYMQMI